MRAPTDKEKAWAAAKVRDTIARLLFALSQDFAMKAKIEAVRKVP